MKKVYAVTNAKRIMSDLTRGKKYLVLSENKEDFMICTDNGVIIRPCWTDSASLHGEDWERLEIEDDEVPRTFENLDKPFPDGTIPILKLFDVLLKQIYDKNDITGMFSCEFSEDCYDITVVANSSIGTRFMMILYKKSWNLCFYADRTPLFINSYPLYQKLFDWGFLTVNK